jgi:hypothetical protein
MLAQPVLGAQLGQPRRRFVLPAGGQMPLLSRVLGALNDNKILVVE